VLDEHQDIQALKQNGIDVQEVDGNDPSGLGREELPPCRPGLARCRIDAGGTQDRLDGRRRDRDAELDQLAVNPPVPPQRVLPRQADGKTGDAPDRRRPAGLASRARVVLARGQLAVPGQQRRGRDRKDPRPGAAAG
jgi:hypothetical protein